MTSAALTAPDTDTSTPFGLYLHVPFCATRCGYCDFNTYTAGELGTSASPQSWLDGVRRELDLAAATFQRKSGRVPSVDTVFVGGGTPSLLGADGLADLLGAARSSFEFSAGAEVTTESNPESTSPDFFDGIRAAGFTRVSLGMQSAAPHVLAILDRTHTPGRAVDAAREAAAAGFDHVNLDLIYGTPGERDSDLDASLDAVLDAGVDHVSAYALIVEDGTALARRVRRGEIPMPDDDVLAARYERIDETLSRAGFGWYEVSNWARGNGAECRHNIGYWDGGDWWGIGPGAHSYVDGTRFWNVKHPARYAETLSTGELPIADSEVLTAEEQHMERVMLTVRLRTGVAASDLSADEVSRARSFVEEGLLDAQGETFVLTDRGRLLADGVVRDILE
ncbi:radical SAM family heme chaperone HemW [Rhodococcus sp. MEB064]|uniref:radical SAM family heme chaperone HemW n=1 Tax=Rhodococcus sp. MEB064 TaxID=1587522 RepID=UPI0005ACC641|nr:radical SAM family heme chaperone HemW [Rhodococcus sp. MEB064]